MFNVGPGEFVAILAIALIVLGPNRLPEAVRTVGRVVGELRRISSGFQDELRNAFDDGDIIDQLETKPDASTKATKPTTEAIDTAAVGLSGALSSTEPLDGSEESHESDDELDGDDTDEVNDGVDRVIEHPDTDDPPDTDQRAAS